MPASHRFDFTAVAALFPASARSRRSKLRSGFPRQFGTAAEAIRYAIEGLEPELLDGSFLQVGESVFNDAGIRGLYARDTYPFSRQAPSPEARGQS